MKKLGKRDYLLLVGCVGLVLIVVIIQFIIYPVKQKDKEILESFAKAQQKLEKNLSIIGSSDRLDEEYKQLMELIGTFVSEGAEFSSMISNLENLAHDANVHVANIRPQKSYNKEGLYVFPVEVQIDGQWTAIAKFLYLVQAKDSFYNISELNLEKYSDTTGQLRGSIVLNRIRGTLPK